mgnify:CR=1 FL=1
MTVSISTVSELKRKKHMERLDLIISKMIHSYQAFPMLEKTAMAAYKYLHMTCTNLRKVT